MSDTNGTILIPGTYWPRYRDQMYVPGTLPFERLAAIFGRPPILFEWPGGVRSAVRRRAAAELVHFARQWPQVDLIGFSHGGNIAIAATHHLPNVRNLVTIATPVLPEFQPRPGIHHIHIYSPQDRVQFWAGFGRRSRTFPGAINIPVDLPPAGAFALHGNLLWADATYTALS